MTDGAPQGVPGDSFNWPMLKIAYPTDPECIAALLPPGIVPTSDAEVRLTMYHFPVGAEPELGTGQGWLLPPLLRMLDHHYNDTRFSAKLGDYRSHLSMSPADYFRRNCAVGASCMPRADADIRHEMGLDQIMWGTDYPHPEGTWPNTAPRMRETFRGLPEEDVAAMLGGNAVAFYDLDAAGLAEVASRVGPPKARFAA